jgi:diaminopimelate decarboxylase
MKATEALAAARSALMIEPGRSIVSDSGITLARVAFEKRVDPRPARLLLEANGDWTYLKRAESYQEIFS